MEEIRKPFYKILWQSKDVSLDLAPYLVSLTYIDRLYGESDSVELTFEDRDDRWKNAWYPQKGDELNVMIGIEDRWLKAGIFQIDEIEFSSPADTVCIRGLSSFVKKSLRQKKTKAWENATLKSIINSIANSNGLDTQIEIKPDIFFKRIDQKSTSDLSFVKMLAEKYGYYTKIDHEKLIFVKKEKLENLNPVISFKKGKNIVAFHLKDKATRIYKACEVRYFNPQTKKQITYTVEDENVISGDILKINERVENIQQAKEIAKAKLKDANRLKTSGSITTFGEPYLVAGAKVELVDFGLLSGEYLIEEAEHTIEKSEGYKTTVRIRKC